MQVPVQDYNHYAQMRADALSMSPEAFMAKHRSPVLLMEQHSPPTGSNSDFTQETRGASGPMLHAGPNNTQPTAVLPVVKRATHDFDGRIYVGRESKSDIVLEYPDVSRIHAYFIQGPERDTYLLADAGSKNGTRVNGMHLVQGRMTPLKNGMRLMFGWRDVVFFLPKGLYHHFVGDTEEP